MRANLMGPGRGCGGWELSAAPRSPQPGESPARVARTGPSCARARCPPPAARPPRSPSAHSALRVVAPVPPLLSRRRRDRGSELSRAGAGAGAAGRAPEVGAEREAGRPGGQAGAWVRPADRPRVEVERGRPGGGAGLRASVPGARARAPSTSPRPPPSPLGTLRPSRCPRPPHPSCCLSPVHLPSRPRAPTPSRSPGGTPAQSYLLWTQHQISLAPPAPICRSLSSVHLSPQLCSPPRPQHLH